MPTLFTSLTLPIIAVFLLCGEGNSGQKMANAATYTIAADGSGDYLTLESLRGDHPSLDPGDVIILKNSDASLAGSFDMSDSGSITFGGNGDFMISSATPGTTPFLVTTAKATLLASNRTEVTFSGFGTVTASSVNASDVIFRNGTITFSDNTLHGAIAAEQTYFLGGTNTFAENSAHWGGGILGKKAVFVGGVNTFTENDADDGGAIFVGNTGSVTFIGGKNSFVGNMAENSGGAIYGSTIWLNDGMNSFSGNSTGVTGDGGAISGDSVCLTGGLNSISENNAANGGAIFAQTVKIQGGMNTFLDNTASNNGGAIFSTNDVLVRAGEGDVIFRGNKANGVANALYMSNATPLGTATNNSLTLGAKGSNRVIFYDPIATNTAASGPVLQTAINPFSDDNGRVIFDGSYWQSQNSNNPDDFTTTISGDVRFSNGRFVTQNGAIFQAGQSFTANGSGLMVSEIYDNAGTWVSSLQSPEFRFGNNTTWVVRNRETTPYNDSIGFQFANATSLTNANAALARGNRYLVFQDFSLDRSSSTPTLVESAKNANISDAVSHIAAVSSLGNLSGAAYSHLDSMDTWCGLGSIPTETPAETAGNFCTKSVWGNYVGRSTDLRAESQLYTGEKLSLQSNGVQVGADLIRHPFARFGVLFGFESAKGDLAQDRLRGSEYQVALYGQKMFFNGFDLRGICGYGHQTFGADRYDFLDDHWNRADFAGNACIAATEVGFRRYLTDNLSLRPHLGIDFVNNNIDGTTETGIDPLTFGNSSLTRCFAIGGLDGWWKHGLMNLNLGGTYSYQMIHDAGSTRVLVNNARDAAYAYGPELGYQTITLKGGVQCYLNEAQKASLFANYYGDLFVDRPGTPWGHSLLAGAQTRF